MGSLFYPDFMPEQIIWSADETDENIIKVAKSRILPPKTVFKLDRYRFECSSKDLITEIQDMDYYVFADTKIAEIPDKVMKISEVYFKYGPWMLNVMANICSTGKIEDEDPKKIDGLKRFADGCAKYGIKSCAVTVLTSKDEEMCKQEFGTTPMEQVIKYVELMTKCGLTDIVCSPLEAEEIRKHREFDGLCINTPGIRLKDTSKDDQQRVMTPYLALENGSDRLVIGRNLTEGDGDFVDLVKRNYERIIWDISGEDY